MNKIIDIIPTFDDDSILWDIWLSRLYLPAVGVADKIGVFNCIHNGNNNLTNIAKSLCLNKLGIDALICFLSSTGLLSHEGDHIVLTPSSKKYLLHTSKFYWGDAFVRTYETDEFKRIFTAIIDKPAQLHSHGKNLSHMWQNNNLDSSSAESFTKIMHSTIHQAAVFAISSGKFAQIMHLLDVGGGSGCFAEAFIKHYPQSSATIFELPEVCKVLENTITAPITLCRGNFFINSLPKTCDGILFSNILHDWELNKVNFLIKKAFDALPIGGKIFIHEMLLNQDRCGPKTATAFNLLMYINHSSQQFTKIQLYELLEIAGFSHCHCTQTHTYYSLIVAEKVY